MKTKNEKLSIGKFVISKLNDLSNIKGGSDDPVIGDQTNGQKVKSSLPCLMGGGN